MNKAYVIIRDDLKSIAKDIIKMKSKRKKIRYGYITGLAEKRQEYRHKHIAHCELRGKSREQIEQPKEGNEPNEYLIEKYIKQFTELIKEHGNRSDENVCTNKK